MKPFVAAIAVATILLASCVFLAVGGVATRTEVDLNTGRQRDLTRIGSVIVSSKTRETWLSSIAIATPGPPNWVVVLGSDSSGQRVTYRGLDAMYVEQIETYHQQGQLTDSAADAVGRHVLSLWEMGAPKDDVILFSVAVQRACRTRTHHDPIDTDDVHRIIIEVENGSDAYSSPFAP